MTSKKKSPFKRLPLVAAALLALGVIGSAHAEVPARFYWKSLTGGSGVPLIVESISGNANPFDASHLVSDDLSIDATLAIAGYAEAFALLNRSATAAILLPMGRISGEQRLPNGGSVSQSASGFGDPIMELSVNLIGPSPQVDIPGAMRYEPGFSLDLLADISVPIGEYNSQQSLNIGQNRWYGRIGAPTVIQLGDWVPGKRTTLELLPSIWFFGDNDDFVGRNLQTEPLLEIDAHLTRDFTTNLWGSIDSSWYKGAKASIDGVAGSERNDLTLGFTLGYTINRNIGLTASYRSTINDSAPGAMRMDSFMLTLMFGWHPLIEGFERLKAE